MSLARNLLLSASRSPFLARELRRRRFFQRATRRFMPGEELSDALTASQSLAAQGMGTILTQLGEQVTSPAEAAAVRDHYLGVFDQVKARSLPTEVSVKLTHLGIDIDRAACETHLRVLAARAHDSGSVLWLDMEESRYVDATLELYRKLKAGWPRIGIAIQAYLHRTPADIESLIPLEPTIRLVKGAYREPASIAIQTKPDVSEQYFTLASKLLEHAGTGTRAVFGTHDMDLVARIQKRAAERGTDRQAFEFHMLYGIRTADQRALASSGFKTYVLISYGSAWFAWYMRRLAERPANVWYVLRNLV
jgi:proline dehydrogenase